MADKITNAEAVKEYHKKLVNLATVRIPSPEEAGTDYKKLIENYLQTEQNGQSLNSYILELIEADMAAHGYEIKIAKGVKQAKKEKMI